VRVLPATSLKRLAHSLRPCDGLSVLCCSLRHRLRRPRTVSSAFGSGAPDSHETDVARLTYRRPLGSDAQTWWRPRELQLGAGVWRVPHLGARTRRYDASLTPVWRSESAFGYIEGGIGVYLLSHTINNETNVLRAFGRPWARRI
jgi:hypothetical protein